MLGFDRAKVLMFGAAPIKQSTADFFAGFDIPLKFNMYGLSEVTGTVLIAF